MKKTCWDSPSHPCYSRPFAVAAEYKIDKEGQHAFVNFRIQHLGYSWLYGTFKDFDGTFTFDEKIRRQTK